MKHHVTNIKHHDINLINHVSNIINHNNVKNTKITEVEKFSKNHDNNIINHDSNLMHHDTNIINHVKAKTNHDNKILKHSNKNSKHANKNPNHVTMFLNYTSMFKNHTIMLKNLIPYIPAAGMLVITGLVTINLRTLPSSAETSSSVTVDSGCSLVSKVSTEHAGTIINGIYSEIPGSTTISSVCNGAYDSQISAIGFSNDTDGNINLISDLSTIPGNTPFQNNTADFSQNGLSGWYMKLTSTNELLTIDNDFDSCHTIPESSIKVASTKLTTDGSTKLGFTTKYSAYISTSQSAGTYVGKVKYTLSSVTPSVLKIYMQNMTIDQCTTTPLTVYDSRDEEEYTVQRLNDGNCWLLDNLRLDSSTVTMTVDNTNMKDGVSATATDGSIDSYTAPQINTIYKNDIAAVAYGLGSGKVGVYYNYCAASANTYCTNSSSGSGNASYDVCPKGWRMPTSGANGEYRALYTAYGNNVANFLNAFSAPFSGNIYYTSQYIGNYGRFWSSTYRSAAYMYYLNVTSSEIDPQSSSSRYGRNQGYSIRCLLK